MTFKNGPLDFTVPELAYPWGLWGDRTVSAVGGAGVFKVRLLSYSIEKFRFGEDGEVLAFGYGLFGFAVFAAFFVASEQG